MIDLIHQHVGNYRLLRLLQHGKAADVYLGEHISLKSTAAMKVYSLAISKSEQENFLLEGSKAASLDDPNIVKVLDWGLYENYPFLVMDYMPDDTFSRRYPEGTVLSPSIIIPYIRDIARALQYIHGLHLIHRNLKPTNLFLGQNQHILLSDFRIELSAHGSRSRTIEGMEGSAAYLAPEQIQGKPCPASDQYALAVLVYTWLTGELPFQGSFTEQCNQHLRTAPVSLRKKNPSLSPAVEEVIQITLAKDAERRFLDIQTFADAFADAAIASERPNITPRHTDATTNASSATRQASNALPISAIQASKAASKIFYYPLSRRTMLFALAGLAIVGGSLTEFVLSQRVNTIVKPGTLLYTFTGNPPSMYVASAAWSTDGQLIASGGGNIQVSVWHDMSGAIIQSLSGSHEPLNVVTWSPDGTRIASGSTDQKVWVWNVRSGKPLLIYAGHTEAVNTLAWSHNTLYIASGGYDNTVQVWDASNGKAVFTYRGHSDAIWGIAWSPDGKRIASASFDRTVQVWDTLDGGNVITYQGHRAEVHTVAWSPDGQYIASGGFDQTVQVWDASTGQHILTYYGHKGNVNDAVWSPDSAYIASASADKTVQIWKVLTGDIRLTYRGHSGSVYTVAWSPVGERIASGGSDGTVQIWQAIS